MRERKLSDPVDPADSAKGMQWSDGNATVDNAGKGQSFFHDVNNVITGALMMLCVLAALDLWRQYAINR